MRTALVDITMPPEQQSGKKSRRVCKEPSAPWSLGYAGSNTMWDMWDMWDPAPQLHPRSKSLLERLAQDCQLPPPTPVVGNVIVRHMMMPMEAFYEKLTPTHPHRRAVTVEITIPHNLLK